MAGAAISVQYFATLLSRPLEGRRTADTLRPKKTVLYGLAACAARDALLLFSALAAQWHVVNLVLLVVARLILGFGESWVGTGSITWGIGRVGVSHNAKVISWNGIATYGALAIGAPLGVAIEHALGFATLGLIVIALGAIGYWLATRMESGPIVHGERMSYRSVFFRVLPHGIGLALGFAGFGSIATFITLFCASLAECGVVVDRVRDDVHWGAALVRQYDQDVWRVSRGDRVVLVRMPGFVDALALGGAYLWLAGAALTGFGFALVFPVLGVEAVGLVPPASRGVALSAYSVFLDLSLGLTGPLAGYIAGEFGYGSVFLFAALAAALAVGLSVALYLRGRGVGGTARA